MRWRLFPILVLVWFAPGCLVLHADNGSELPELADVRSLQARRATRAEVLVELGPSDELRSPRPMQARRLEPGELRVAEDGRLIDRRHLSYSHERRLDRRFLLLPILSLFTWQDVEVQVDRLQLFFDEEGRLDDAAWQIGGGA